MHRLIYISRSLIGCDRDKLDVIVDRSIVRNQANDITGMLWSDGASFAQVLEGEHEAIANTMSRIYEDHRHADIELVLDRPVAQRMFGHWAMVLSESEPESIEQTAFLIGFAASQRTRTSRRLYDIIMTSDEQGSWTR